MNWLTKQEQTVLWLVLALLLTGLAVKTYRARHPGRPEPSPATESQERQPASTVADPNADTRF